MRIEFHPEAAAEMLDGALFYEERVEGLGTDFLAAVEQASLRIVQFPDAGPMEGFSIRKKLVFGFPFTILYSRQKELIYILAVMHQHRKPGYWKGRLGA